MEKAYLVLQNGQVFEGFSFGAKAKSIGELVFTTGMCGYIETLTEKPFGWNEKWSDGCNANVVWGYKSV